MERFYYPGPEAEKRVIAQETGHVAILTIEPRELPPIMHAAALSAGCLREGTTPAAPVAPSLSAHPHKPLREALIEIADAALPGTVDGEGRPLPDAVREKLGISVADNVIYQQWAEVEQGILDEDITPPPPIAELTDEQINLISELAQASFRTLQERVPAIGVKDIVVLQQVADAEARKAQPRNTVLTLLQKRYEALVAEAQADAQAAAQ